MRIGEVCQATGVGIETIRYYEREGLLPAPVRSENGYRNYSSAHLERLSFIRHCRVLDMPLAEIKRMLDFVTHPEADCGEVNRIIDEQLIRVRVRLKSMRMLEKQLTQLRAHCEAGHTAAECGILHELGAAAHTAACSCDTKAATE